MATVGSKQDKAKAIAKQKAFGKKSKTKGARILNDKEKHALRMEGAIGKILLIWEDLRRKDGKNKEDLINQVLEMQKGRLVTTSRKPQFARVYQSCAKYGTPAQLQVFFDAFKGQVLLISTSPYGHQMVTALMTYAKPDQKKELVDEIVTNASAMIRRKYGQRVLEHLYSSSNVAMQRKILLHIFDRVDLKAASDNYRLGVEEVWEEDGRIRGACSKVLCSLMERCVDRGLVDPPIMHRLLDLAFRHCEHSKNLELLDDVKKQLIHISSTLYGARVTNQCLKIAGANTRADILGTFANSCIDIAMGKHSSLMLMSMLDIVDDTKMVQKLVLTELAKSVEELLTDNIGSRLLMHLLTPETAQKKRFFDHQWKLVCHSENEDWDTMDVVASSSSKDGAPRTKQIKLCETSWVEKHDAALAYLLPKVKAHLSKDYKKYAENFFARRVMTQIVHYAEEADPKWKGSTKVDKEFVTQLKEILGTTKVALERKKKPEGGVTFNKSAPPPKKVVPEAAPTKKVKAEPEPEAKPEPTEEPPKKKKKKIAKK